MSYPKNKSTLSSGRSASMFEDSFSRSFTVRIMTSPAYRKLAPAAKDVCNLMFVKNDNSKFHKRKADNGKPVFTFTVAEAIKLLGISNTTFSKALNQLDEHGLIERHKRGGLLGANGTASEFTLSSRWKNWEPGQQHAGHDNIKAARKAIKKATEKTKPPGYG